VVSKWWDKYLRILYVKYQLCDNRSLWDHFKENITSLCALILNLFPCLFQHLTNSIFIFITNFSCFKSVPQFLWNGWMYQNKYRIENVPLTYKFQNCLSFSSRICLLRSSIWPTANLGVTVGGWQSQELTLWWKNLGNVCFFTHLLAASCKEDLLTEGISFIILALR
jgi:hypothetical protein